MVCAQNACDSGDQDIQGHRLLHSHWLFLGVCWHEISHAYTLGAGLSIPIRRGELLTIMHRTGAVLVFAAMLAGPAGAQSVASPDDALHREVSGLAERLSRLESENAALKQANESLTGRVAELEAQVAGEDSAGDSGKAVATVPVAVGSAPAAAPTPQPWYEKIKVSGLVFGDAYAVVDHHDPTIDDRTGFWIRRGYLTFDSRLASEWSARLRFEVNSPGDFSTNSKLEPFVKDAYLAWKREGHELYFGLSPSPTFDFVETFWGQRPLEKTPLDLYRFGSSRDMGVAYKGSASNGKVFYHAMFGNGSGDGSETNDGKKLMGSLGLRPTDALVLQLYADYEDRPGATDRSTWQALAGWAGARSRYGLQYASQQREVQSAPDEDVAVASVFGVWHLTEPGTLTVRFDRNFDGYEDADKIPYLRVATATPFDLAILAWQHDLHPNISLIPSLEYVHYRSADGTSNPDDDLYGRLTLYFGF
jgi:hypothetical protein